MTIIMFNIIDIGTMPHNFPFVLGLFINAILGAFLGFVASAIFAAIAAGGDMINTQMGLSSAMVMDPSTNSQTSILSRMITMLGICIFIEIGGLYWLFNAFVRSFQIFPIYAVQIPLEQIINMDYLVKTTSNVLSRYFNIYLLKFIYYIFCYPTFF